MNGESGPVCLPSVIVRRDGASQCSPHSEGMRRRVFRTVGDVAAEERNGHEQPVAFAVLPGYIHVASPPHMRGRGTHTQHVAIPEPTTVNIRAQWIIKLHAREPRRTAHVGGQFIVV